MTILNAAVGQTVRELLRKDWQVLFLSSLLFLAISLLGLFFFVQGQAAIQGQIKERLRSVAAASALQFQGDDLAGIRTPKDKQTPAFQKTVRQLHGIIKEVPRITSAYLMRKTDEPMILQFIADADSFLTPADRDKNGNGKVDENEVEPLPGDPYDAAGLPAMYDEAFLHPSVDEDVNTDQWGTVISGYAPIRDKNGLPVAILGLDMTVQEYARLSHSVFSPAALMMVGFAGVCIAFSLILSARERRLEAFRKIDEERAGIMLLLSHQLGTPITLLKWSLECLRDPNPGVTLEHGVEEHMRLVERGLGQLNRVMDAMNRADQIQSGSLKVNPGPLHLLTLVEDILGEFNDRCQKERKSIRRFFDADVTLTSDRRLLAVVLRELVSNALDFSPEGCIVTVRSHNEKGHVEVEVQDRGEGIPLSDLRHLFEKFTRGSNAVRYKPDGNGLGLFIAKGIIEHLGGRMWATTEPGKGATIVFTVPLR